MRVLHDLSPAIDPTLAVWPGDTPFQRNVAMSIATTHLELSAIATTVHLGAHADAPLHVLRDGAAIGARDLAPYLGACQVIRRRLASGGTVRRSDLPTKLLAPRVLLDTGTYPTPHRFAEDYAAVDPDAIDALADAGAVLLGLDTPSLDGFTATDMVAHRRLFGRGMSVLEGLLLSGVPEGLYTLIALPLRLTDADASPVRAVLVDLAG